MTDRAAVEAEVAYRLGQGDALSAFDCAAAARREGVDSPRLRYLMVRALAASGDSLGAMHLYEQLDLAATGDVDSLALAGRIWKDEAFDHEGAERALFLRKAAAAYENAFKVSIYPIKLFALTIPCYAAISSLLLNIAVSFAFSWLFAAVLRTPPSDATADADYL